MNKLKSPASRKRPSERQQISVATVLLYLLLRLVWETETLPGIYSERNVERKRERGRGERVKEGDRRVIYTRLFKEWAHVPKRKK